MPNQVALFIDSVGYLLGLLGQGNYQVAIEASYLGNLNMQLGQLLIIATYIIRLQLSQSKLSGKKVEPKPIQ